MGETANTFSKGLNQDLSKGKHSPDTYYDALNIETITTTGLSTGAISTTRGNRLEFVVPNLTTATYETSSETGAKVIPALTNLEITGGTSYDKYFIIFTVSGTYLQVWKVEYNEATNTLVGLSGTSLVQATHLIYNRNLNASNTARIKAYVRNESSKFIRLYWNDSINPMRVLNLSRSNADILETRVRTIELHPISHQKLPVVQELVNGNLPNCRIGYFYRQISKDGAVTAFSSISNLIDLNNGNEAGLYEFYPESPIEFKDENENIEAQKRLDFSAEKGCKVLISDLDLDYDYIQVGYVQYTVKNVPELFLLPEEVINANNHLFIHSGLEEGVVPITVADFNALNNTFETFTDFVPKQNELYITNITNSEFDVDYDARAYRYKSNKTTYVTFPVAEDADAINPFNDEDPASNPNWLTTDQYKFQSDDVTVGGEGLNVKYYFTTDNHLSDTTAALHFNVAKGTILSDNDNIAPFNNITLETSPTATFNGAIYPINKSYSDLKSPYKSSLYEGYARGEVYRFGLTFVKKNGQKSFVKWIGDIKFPFVTDVEYELDGITIKQKFQLDELITNGAIAEYYVKSLGIVFEIDNIPDIDNLSHIEIVRVERTEEDRTKLGTGVTGGFVKFVHRPLTLSELNGIIQAVVEQLLKKVLGAPGGFWDWTSDIISSQLAKIIANAFTGGFGGGNAQMFENLSKDDVDTILTSNAGQLGAKGGSGGNIVNVMTGPFGSKIGAWLMNKIGEDIKSKKVAGVANAVYSLDNVRYNGTDTFSITNTGYAALSDKFYILSPINQFDKYKYRAGDYIKPLASYEYKVTEPTYKLAKLYELYHRDTDVGVFNRTHSTAKVRKWYNPYYFNDAIDITGSFKAKLNIDLENTLDVGEILKPNQISGLDGVISNSYIGYLERLDNDGNYYLNDSTPPSTKFSVVEKVLGIGDKKHFVKTTTAFPNIINSSLVAGNYYVYDQQGDTITNKDSNGNWKGLYIDNQVYGQGFPVENAPEANADTVATLCLTRPNVVDSSGNFLVSYERYVAEQYGGNTYVARSLNKYINVATLTKDTLAVNNNLITCYKGDTYVGLYDTVNYAYYMEQLPGYDPAVKTKKACGDLFPAEAPFNFNVREGQHFNNSANADDLDFTEKRVKRALRKAKRKSKRSGLDFNEVAKIIAPKRFLYDSHIYDDIYDQYNSIQLALPKPVIDIFTDTNTNRIYKSNKKIDGELIDSWRTFKALDFIDVEGVYGPITSIHNHRDRLYFYQKNAFGIVTTNERATATTSTGTLAIANSNPLSRYDYVSLETGCSHQFGVVNTDNALFHFDINNKKMFQFSEGLVPLSDVGGLSSYFRNNLIEGSINTLDRTLGSDPAGLHGIYDNTTNRIYYTFLNKIGEDRNDFTINYNLLSKSFESFHSFTPGLYIKTPKKLYSVNPAARSNCYLHGFGNYNSYYAVLHPSMVNILTNENPIEIKTFDNHLLFTEVTDTNGVNLVNETISSIECYNDYQTSGVIPLVVNNNIRRMDRKWHLQIPRDSTTSAYTTLKSRLSDTHLFSKFTYNNTLNRKLILHDIYTFYRDSVT